MKKYLLAIAGIAAVLLMLPVEAAMQLPNYAQGGADLKVSLQSTGQRITEVAMLVVGIAAICGMLVGAYKIATGNAEDGKGWVMNSFIALVIAGAVYGIAALAL